MKFIGVLAAFAVLLFPASAQSACTGPAGAEGQIIYNTDYHVPQYCNGAKWMAFSELDPAAGGSGCTGPAATEGRLLYKGDYHVLQYCDGTNWMRVGSSSGISSCSGPSDCSSIGNVCGDGTVFFGCNPRTGIPLFTTPCDAGQSWDGSACTGTRDQEYWADSSSATGLRTTGVVSAYDGKGNTAALTNGVVSGTGDARTSAGLQTHNAAQYCADLSSNGQTDWYLPGEAELLVMAMNRGAIGSNTFNDATWYWSSTEEYPIATSVMAVLFQTDASRELYADGMLNKNQLSNLRCVRQ
jgi:hypothetical protein